MAVFRSSKATLEPAVVSRGSTTLPQAAQTAYFTVTGRILLTQIVGEVTVVIETQETILNLIANPTVGADVPLCTGVDMTADAVGTLYTITGDVSDAIQVTTSGAVDADANFEKPIVVAAGTIDLNSDNDSSSGETKWTLHYIPLDAGSYVTEA